MEQKYENPPNNIGAIFEKCNSTSSYYIIKVTLDNKNYTLCGFKNKRHSGEEFSSEPLFYLFPYKPKDKNYNNE